MEERHVRVPATPQHLDERRRREHARLASRPRCTRAVAAGTPEKQVAAEDEPRLTLVEDDAPSGSSSNRAP